MNDARPGWFKVGAEIERVSWDGSVRWAGTIVEIEDGLILVNINDKIWVIAL